MSGGLGRRVGMPQHFTLSFEWAFVGNISSDTCGLMRIDRCRSQFERWWNGQNTSNTSQLISFMHKINNCFFLFGTYESQKLSYWNVKLVKAVTSCVQCVSFCRIHDDEVALLFLSWLITNQRRMTAALSFNHLTPVQSNLNILWSLITVQL